MYLFQENNQIGDVFTGHVILHLTLVDDDLLFYGLDVDPPRRGGLPGGSVLGLGW